MHVVFNPKDGNTFCSASMDRTLKVWSLSSPKANYTLQGHQKGVNCVEYYEGSDKPYLISGADDKLIKVWDYQNKACVQTLEGHTNNVMRVMYHPSLPILISGSEDGTVRIWHSNTYRLENTLYVYFFCFIFYRNYGMERVWCMACVPESNDIAFGYDEGAISIKVKLKKSYLLILCSLVEKSLLFPWTAQERLYLLNIVKSKWQISSKWI